MQLGILFWFYKDAPVCENRLHMLRRYNPGVPVYGLYGGPLAETGQFLGALGPLLEDFWSFPGQMDSQWKWRNGDLMLADWYSSRGKDLDWDSVFVAQWDMVVSAPLRKFLPPLEAGDMILSGLRPVREVEPWWRWTQGEFRSEYEKFMAHVAERHGAVEDPQCCQFIGLVIPRQFLSRYSGIDDRELGFLEYKVPVYAQVFGTPLVPDTCFRPLWPEEPVETRPKRTECVMHAWASQVRLPVMMYESFRPHGRRVFHPYRGVYPHDVASLGDFVRHGLASR